MKSLNTRELTEQEIEFIERMGMSALADGLSRIAGRIWGVLMISEDPLSSTRLSELLAISKGSLSTNTHSLEALDIIDRHYVSGARQEHFSIKPNPYRILVEGQIKRFETSCKFLAETRKKLPGKTAQRRLKELEQFYTIYGETCKIVITELDKHDRKN
tara:strand:+ start:15384 stop:15860 length:477 start_codon:yes stop_codon:yes gene_type:complete